MHAAPIEFGNYLTPHRLPRGRRGGELAGRLCSLWHAQPCSVQPAQKQAISLPAGNPLPTSSRPRRSGGSAHPRARANTARGCRTDSFRVIKSVDVPLDTHAMNTQLRRVRYRSQPATSPTGPRRYAKPGNDYLNAWFPAVRLRLVWHHSPTWTGALYLERCVKDTSFPMQLLPA